MLIRRSSARFKGRRDYTLSTMREARPTASERLLGRETRAPATRSRRERRAVAG